MLQSAFKPKIKSLGYAHCRPSLIHLPVTVSAIELSQPRPQVLPHHSSAHRLAGDFWSHTLAVFHTQPHAQILLLLQLAVAPRVS